MAHLLKLSEWESATGWHCGDVSDLAKGSGYWWHIPRMLSIPYTDYLLLLKNKYHAHNFYYNADANVLTWTWESYADCHAFVLYVNREARNKKFFIC